MKHRNRDLLAQAWERLALMDRFEADDHGLVRGADVPEGADGQPALAQDAMRKAVLAYASGQNVRPGSIRIRRAVEVDREAGRRIVKGLHAVSLFGDEPFSDAKFDRLADAAFKSSPRRLVVVAERAECIAKAGVSIEDENKIHWRVVGLAYAVADNYLLSENTLIVSTQLIAVELETLGPTGRAKAFLALVNSVKHWGKMIGTNHTMFHVTSAFNLISTEKLMQAAQIKNIGGNYIA